MKLPLLISALCLTACATAVVTTPIKSNPPQKNKIVNNSAPILAGTKWRNTPPSKMTLNFNYNAANGKYAMGGQADCNGAGSEYVQSVWKLKSTSPIAATSMWCENMLEDARLANALENVQSFTIDDRNRLILLDTNKQRLLVMERDLSATP